MHYFIRVGVNVLGFVWIYLKTYSLDRNGVEKYGKISAQVWLLKDVEVEVEIFQKLTSSQVVKFV